MSLSILGAGGIASSAPIGLPTLSLTSIPQPISWETVENGLYEFFAACTNLPISWEDQKAPRRSYPYGTLHILSGPHVLGMDETRVETVSSPAPIKPGKLILCGSREMVVSFRVFCTPNSISPSSHARAFASVIVAALSLPIYSDILRDAGVSVRAIMPLTLPDQQIADAWVSRAVVDVRFGLSSNIEQQIDVIETVHIKAVGDGVGSLPAPLIIDQDFGGTP